MDEKEIMYKFIEITFDYLQEIITQFKNYDGQEFSPDYYIEKLRLITKPLLNKGE